MREGFMYTFVQGAHTWSKCRKCAVCENNGERTAGPRWVGSISDWCNIYETLATRNLLPGTLRFYISQGTLSARTRIMPREITVFNYRYVMRGKAHHTCVSLYLRSCVCCENAFSSEVLEFFNSWNFSTMAKLAPGMAWRLSGTRRGEGYSEAEETGTMGPTWVFAARKGGKCHVDCRLGPQKPSSSSVFAWVITKPSWSV